MTPREPGRAGRGRPEGGHAEATAPAPRQAVILAAGRGERLAAHTADRPKCLLEVGGRTLLEHQVAALRGAGVERVVVVAGYLGHLVAQAPLAGPVVLVENPLYHETSSMYSLWRARGALGNGGFLVLNSDVLFHPAILQALLAAPSPDALAADFHATLADEEMGVRVEGSRVLALAKRLPGALAENLGILRFSHDGGDMLFSAIEELLPCHRRSGMVPLAVSAIAPARSIEAVPTGGLPWIEIDFPEDLDRARNVVYPAIRASEAIATPPLRLFHRGVPR